MESKANTFGDLQCCGDGWAFFWSLCLAWNFCFGMMASICFDCENQHMHIKAHSTVRLFFSLNSFIPICHRKNVSFYLKKWFLAELSRDFSRISAKHSPSGGGCLERWLLEKDPHDMRSICKSVPTDLTICSCHRPARAFLEILLGADLGEEAGGEDAPMRWCLRIAMDLDFAMRVWPWKKLHLTTERNYWAGRSDGRYGAAGKKPGKLQEESGRETSTQER